MQNFKLTSTLSFEGASVGIASPAFIIAEIGVNHNGDLKLAKASIDAAVKAGADCVKFQSFRTEEFMGTDVVYEYQNSGQAVRESMFDMFKRLELPMDWHRELFDYARAKGVVPMTSVADTVIASEVLKIPSGVLKLASEDLINLDLVEFVIKTKAPIIFSTGMASEEEIGDVLELLKQYDHRNVAFLHCVSVYPTPLSEANLNRMLTLREFIGGGVIGYSDHTEGIAASVSAVAMGAKIIEKHFTLDRKMEGPDHSLSSDPEEFFQLVKSIRSAERMLGSGRLEPSETESKTSRLQFRRSVVADRDLKVGEMLAKSDIAYRRPGLGLRPRERGIVLGKRVRRAIQRNEMITAKDVE